MIAGVVCYDVFVLDDVIVVIAFGVVNIDDADINDQLWLLIFLNQRKTKTCSQVFAIERGPIASDEDSF